MPAAVATVPAMAWAMAPAREQDSEAGKQSSKTREQDSKTRDQSSKTRRSNRRANEGCPMSAAADAELVAGRYRLEGRLGFGGMSTVHLAFDERLERRVAVKLLAEHLADDPTFVSRFRREAQAAARLVHPNIVQIFDSGLDERSGRHFIVMEYIEGQSCAEILRDDGWVEVDEAASIVEQACEGLDYAHRHGVVHRDVKPGNLLRAYEGGEVKLADFGIAKATEQSSITQVGSVLGTAAYLAPEQARGEEAGPRADLYALGVVAYQLIAGRLPYEATSLTELALKQQRETPPTLDTLVAAASPELADAVAIALALDPQERYGSAREMGRAVREAMKGIAPTEPASGHRGPPATAATSLLASAPRGRERTVQQRSAVTPRRPRPGPPRQQQPAVARASKRSRAGRIWGTLLAVLVLAAVIAGVILVTTPPSTVVKLHDVVYRDVGHSAKALQELIAENEKP
jgi:serine/threonine protein kinase